MALMSVDGVDTVTILLPDGDQFALRRSYTADEARGILVLAVISCISAAAVTGLLFAMAVSAYRTRNATSPKLFVRSHVAAYFVSMLFCEVVQSIGSIMNVRWFNQIAVTYEPYCTVQGVLKHVSDVGTAYWSLVIAMNTFWILFLRWRLRKFVLIGALVIGWAAIGAIITAGPTAIQTVEKGPFYAISGYWCWIQDEYSSEGITLDYMIMFISALLSTIMYVLVFLRLRGNILVHGWHISFHRRHRSPERSPRSIDTHAVNVAKAMLLYPLAYTILLLPIAICRFTEWTGHKVPFAVTIVSDSIFLLAGLVDVILFLTTRRVLPANSVFPQTVTRLFSSRANADANRPRLSVYTTSSAFTDVEKIGYDVSTLAESGSTESPRPLPSPATAAGTGLRVPDTSYPYPSGRAIGSYDPVSLNSAATMWSWGRSPGASPIPDIRLSPPPRVSVVDSLPNPPTPLERHIRRADW